MATIRYTPQLKDLLFVTTAARFFDLLKGTHLEQLATILILKNVDSVIPALSLLEREKVYDRLIEGPVIPFICSFNVRDVELNLPILPGGQKYESLKEIDVDELNIVMIMQMMEYDLFPNLRSLAFLTSGPIRFKTSNLKQLRFLTLQNASNAILPLPHMEELELEELTLGGYVLEFRNRLPRKLTLEYCFIERSRGLTGCQEMVLFNTRWDEMSLPVLLLRIERGRLLAQPPLTLEHLLVIDSEIGQDVRFDQLPKLKSVRFDSVWYETRPGVENQAEIDIILRSPGLMEMTIVPGDIFSNIPDSLQTLRVGKMMPRYISNSVMAVELESIEIRLREFFLMLPENLSIVNLIKCNFGIQEDIEARDFPPSLKVIRFNKCKSKNVVMIAPPFSLRELIIIGRTPVLNGEGVAFPYTNLGSLRWLRSATNTLLMDLREFELYCLDRLNKNIFDEYEDCFLDATRGAAYFTGTDDDPEDILPRYIEILLEKYPFHIPQPQDPKVIKAIIVAGNKSITVKIGNNSYTLEYIRNLISVRSPAIADEEIGGKKDKLRDFVELARKIIEEKE